MPLFILKLGESAMKESSPEHSEDGGETIRSGDGKKGLASGMCPIYFAQVMLVSDIEYG